MRFFPYLYLHRKKPFGENRVPGWSRARGLSHKLATGVVMLLTYRICPPNTHAVPCADGILRAVKCLRTDALTNNETVDQMDRPNEIWPRAVEDSKVTGVRTITSQPRKNYIPLENETRTPRAQTNNKEF